MLRLSGDISSWPRPSNPTGHNHQWNLNITNNDEQKDEEGKVPVTGRNTSNKWRAIYLQLVPIAKPLISPLPPKNQTNPKEPTN